MTIRANTSRDSNVAPTMSALARESQTAGPLPSGERSKQLRALGPESAGYGESERGREKTGDGQQCHEWRRQIRKLNDDLKDRNQQVGQVMREARKFKQYRISDCARILGTSRQRYSKMEAGTSAIGMAEFDLLMRELDMPEEWLAKRLRLWALIGRLNGGTSRLASESEPEATTNSDVARPQGGPVTAVDSHLVPLAVLQETQQAQGAEEAEYVRRAERVGSTAYEGRSDSPMLPVVPLLSTPLPPAVVLKPGEVLEVCDSTGNVVYSYVLRSIREEVGPEVQLSGV